MILLASDIQIDDFIFHVVHHGADEPVLMDKTPITGFEIFFKERIAEVLEGNRFTFTDSSLLLDEILKLDKDISTFVEVSKRLAVVFHQHQDKRIKPGVMILINCLANKVRKYILIKYDNEEVITYKTKGTEATLEEVSNTFTKNKSALQKSAVIDLSDNVLSAVVIDKSERHNVTDFFKGFLGIKRQYSNSELTKKLNECFLETVKEHRGSLPPEFTSNANKRFYDIVQKMNNFNENETLRILFEQYYSIEIERTFKRKLKKRDMLGEEFLFDKSIKKPSKRKLKTAEGISIQYDYSAEDTIKIEDIENGTKITIETSKLFDEK